jgi:hypothetical protein
MTRGVSVLLFPTWNRKWWRGCDVHNIIGVVFHWYYCTTRGCWSITWITNGTNFVISQSIGSILNISVIGISKLVGTQLVINLKDIVYPKTYYRHIIGDIQVDETSPI